MAQQVGIVLVLVPGDEGVEALDDQADEGVNDVAGVASILEAVGDLLAEADEVVELAQDDESGVGGNAATVEVEANLSVAAEGESGLERALCTHGRSLPKQRFGLLTTLFRRSCRFPCL